MKATLLILCIKFCAPYCFAVETRNNNAAPKLSWASPGYDDTAKVAHIQTISGVQLPLEQSEAVPHPGLVSTYDAAQEAALNTMVNIFQQAQKDGRPVRVLDFGCGAGNFETLIQALCCMHGFSNIEVIALDGNIRKAKEMEARLNKREATSGNKVRFTFGQCLAQDFPQSPYFKKGYYDIVCCFNVLHLLGPEERKSFLQNLYQTLTPWSEKTQVEKAMFVSTLRWNPQCADLAGQKVEKFRPHTAGEYMFPGEVNSSTRIFKHALESIYSLPQSLLATTSPQNFIRETQAGYKVIEHNTMIDLLKKLPPNTNVDFYRGVTVTSSKSLRDELRQAGVPEETISLGIYYFNNLTGTSIERKDRLCSWDSPNFGYFACIKHQNPSGPRKFTALDLLFMRSLRLNIPLFPDPSDWKPELD